MPLQSLSRTLPGRLPFYYGWVVLACVCFAGFSRQGPAVATLSIFVEPMTSEFGWSRTALSGAVSLGGLLAAVASPFIGPYLDRRGPRAVLCLAVLSTAATTMLLSLTQSLVVFYLLFCFARMNFAGPYDLGIYGAVSNWFVERRAFAISIATLAQMAGLVSLPLIAHFAMQATDWRGGWLAVGATVLVVGFVPTWLFMVRRPEDVGLVPDGRRSAMPEAEKRRPAEPATTEPAFSRRQAMATPAFWLLSLFTLLVYPVQAGVSLHQAPHLIERGLDPTVAATVVSSFSLVSGLTALALGFWPRRLPVNLALALTGVALGVSALSMLAISSAVEAYLAAVFFGIGIGGLITMLPLAWANYFGRASFGAIRGAALTVQVLAQASGPLLSGVLRDLTGDYVLSLQCFAGLAFVGAGIALAARAPRAAG
ncbi:MAG: MFS transporter [Alphaproteobacteria bacterium]|jgi:sugar phosphate permease|nr:MFS transporter [Alphaproteobacteria bacterium]